MSRELRHKFWTGAVLDPPFWVSRFLQNLRQPSKLTKVIKTNKERLKLHKNLLKGDRIQISIKMAVRNNVAIKTSSYVNNKTSYEIVVTYIYIYIHFNEIHGIWCLLECLIGLRGMDKGCPQDARQRLGSFPDFELLLQFRGTFFCSKTMPQIKTNQQVYYFLVTTVTCSTGLLVLSRCTLWNVKHWSACGY